MVRPVHLLPVRYLHPVPRPLLPDVRLAGRLPRRHVFSDDARHACLCAVFSADPRPHLQQMEGQMAPRYLSGFGPDSGFGCGYDYSAAPSDRRAGYHCADCHYAGHQNGDRLAISWHRLR